MALPFSGAIEQAVKDIFNALSEHKTRTGKGRAGVAALSEVKAALAEAYRPRIDVTLSDTDAADLDALFDGVGSELVAALGRNAQVGDVFQVGSSADTTDDALAAVKDLGWVYDITVTDTDDATIAAYLGSGGEAADDLISRPHRAGERFMVAGTGDTTDDALEAAKGSAPADGDVFQVNDAVDGVVFIGNNDAVEDGDVFVVTNVTTEAVAYIGKAVDFDANTATDVADFTDQP
jgi:hypothetical protein